MGTSNQLESNFEKQQAQAAAANPELNLVALSGGGKGGDSQPVNFGSESTLASSNASSFLPKIEIGGIESATRSEKQSMTASTVPVKQDGGSGRSRGSKKLTTPPDWTNLNSGYAGAGASSESGAAGQMAASAGPAGGESSVQARSAASPEGMSASAFSAFPEGAPGRANAEHTWSDQKAADHAAGAASTDDYNAQQQQGDADSHSWNNTDASAQHNHIVDNSAPATSDQSAVTSTNDLPIDTLTNNMPVAGDTTEEPTPIEATSTTVSPGAPVGGGTTTGAGATAGAGQQGSATNAPTPTNDAGSSLGAANAAAVSQPAANLMNSFPTVSLTNSGTQSPTNASTASSGAGRNTVSPYSGSSARCGDRAVSAAESSSSGAPTPIDVPASATATDQAAVGSDLASNITGSSASFDQQLEAQLQQLRLQIQQISTELEQYMGGSANGAAPPVDNPVPANPSTTPVDTTTPSAPVDTTAPSTPVDTTAASTPVDTTTPSTPVDITTPAGSDTDTSTTTTTIPAGGDGGGTNQPATAAPGDSSTVSGTQPAQADSATGTTTFTLSPQLQQIVNQLGLTPIVSGPVVDNVTGYGGSGATAEPLSDYGTPDGNGGFTITNDPSTWGGDLTPTTAATGEQLFVADVKFNPSTVGLATWNGGNMTSWPAIWANSGQNSGSDLKQEIDTLEYFGDTNSPNAASTLHDWTTTNDTAGSSAVASTAIDPILFANASTTGIEVASLINTQNDTITNYINGQQVSSFNINSGDPAATTPVNWLMGTGNGEAFDVTNMALFTPVNGVSQPVDTTTT